MTAQAHWSGRMAVRLDCTPYSRKSVQITPKLNSNLNACGRACSGYVWDLQTGVAWRGGNVDDSIQAGNLLSSRASDQRMVTSRRHEPHLLMAAAFIDALLQALQPLQPQDFVDISLNIILQ